MIDQTQFLERQQFFDGQRLFADDLQEIERFHRTMRELHNRSLHQPGVGSGFAVTGNVGDREVRIGPGYALDDLGREIIHTITRSEPIPPVSGDPDGTAAYFDLTVFAPGDDDLDVSELRQGICTPPGVVRRREQPALCWARLERLPNGELAARLPFAGEMASGRKVRIARVGVQDCRLKSLSIAERQNARPPQQPYIFCGSEAIESYQSSKLVGGLHLVTCEIDTKAAGFATTPHYYATFRSETAPRDTSVNEAVASVQHLFETERSTAAATPVAPEPADNADRALFLPITSLVHDAEPTRFTWTSLVFATGARRVADAGDDAGDPIAAAGEFHVDWIGVE